jgi:phosphate transport system substrate-binding protein
VATGRPKIVSSWIARRLAAVGFVTVAAVSIFPAEAQEVLGETGVRGAGSTLVYPVLSKWSREYREQRARGDFPTSNAGLDDPLATSALAYEPVGSLGGMLRVKDRAVDFASSEMPLGSLELATLGLGQFPIVIGGIVVAVNVAGIGPAEMRFTGPVLADVFLGKITRWSDAGIKALNPTLSLPDARIDVVHRSDGSGTTFNFADYLSKVSPQWKAQVGAAMLLQWPTGTPAKGNEGVAQVVQRVKNSIGYVDFAQALEAKLSYAVVQNRTGRFIKPDATSFQAAAASADWRTTSDFHLLLTNAPGENAYPLTATVFVLMHKSASRARTRAALDFFRWSLEKGSSMATQLGYVPLPQFLVGQVKDYWARIFTAGT